MCCHSTTRWVRDSTGTGESDDSNFSESFTENLSIYLLNLIIKLNTFIAHTYADKTIMFNQNLTLFSKTFFFKKEIRRFLLSCICLINAYRNLSIIKEIL